MSPGSHLVATATCKPSMSAGRQFVSRSEARRVFVTSKSTTNFRHLLPVAKPRVDFKNPLDKSPDPVKPKDRIKWWNIVPGDQVRVMAEENAKIREVKGVNKFSNRVFIEGDKKVCCVSQCPGGS